MSNTNYPNSTDAMYKDMKISLGACYNSKIMWNPPWSEYV